MKNNQPNWDLRRAIFSAIILLTLLVILVVVLNKASNINIKIPHSELSSEGFYEVKEVNDGDTIVVDMAGKSETIRFIGVDTPETHKPNTPIQCWGPEASNYTKQVISSHSNKVRLEADPINTNRDRYDRLLRYVYLKDGALLNSQLIKEGQGFAYTSFPFQKSAEFKSYEESAKNSNLGVWANCEVFVNKYGSYESKP